MYNIVLVVRCSRSNESRNDPEPAAATSRLTNVNFAAHYAPLAKICPALPCIIKFTAQRKYLKLT